MYQRILAGALFGITCLGTINGAEPPETSQAEADGPFVFYRGNQIVVKSIERVDTGLLVRSETYLRKSEIRLQCFVPLQEDRFSFVLQDSFGPQPDVYALPSRMMVLSDIEGNFLGLKTMLMGAGVIDRHFHWRYGDGHLVLLGDFVDRGTQVTECLWLIYKLEEEASKAGGKLHFILGNHEILNLQGNTTYVRRKYMDNAALLGDPYRSWFDGNAELGRWLRSKNVVEKIGEFVFCHGGISPEIARSRLSLQELNSLARRYYGKSQETIPAGAAKLVYDYQYGILWYREAARGLISMAQMQEILAFAGAKRMVVGHTVGPDISAQYGGRLICIDLYHEENIRRGFMKCLLIEGTYCYGIDSKGERSPIYPRKNHGG